MPFKDRADAGRKLARALAGYKDGSRYSSHSRAGVSASRRGLLLRSKPPSI